MADGIASLTADCPRSESARWVSGSADLRRLSFVRGWPIATAPTSIDRSPGVISEGGWCMAGVKVAIAAAPP